MTEELLETGTDDGIDLAEEVLEQMFTAEPSGDGDEEASDAVAAEGEPEFTIRRLDTHLFEGDTGQLTYEARQALAAVIKRNYLFQDQHPALWEALMTHRRNIESRLNDLFLQLVVDPSVGIAYKVEASAPEGRPFPKVLNTQNRGYTWTETILLRHLREQYSLDLGRDGQQHVHISRQAMIERLSEDVSSRRNDLTSTHGSAERAFDTIRSAGILIPTDGASGDRFRISPVIVPLMSLTKLKEIQAYLDELDAREGAGEDTDA